MGGGKRLPSRPFVPVSGLHIAQSHHHEGVFSRGVLEECRDKPSPAHLETMEGGGVFVGGDVVDVVPLIWNLA